MVVHSFRSERIGGVECYSYNLAKEMQAKGVSVTVLYPDSSCGANDYTFNSFRYNGLKVVKIRVPFGNIVSSVSSAGYVRERRLQLVSSPVHHQEITAIPELLERTELLAILAGMAVSVAPSDMLALRMRAEYLVRQGAGVADAAHLAFAEAARADF